MDHRSYYVYNIISPISHILYTAIHTCVLCMLNFYCSNLAYGLLGRCIVHHYDPLTTLEKYVEDNILKPLNMTSTGFDYTDQ